MYLTRVPEKGSYDGPGESVQNTTGGSRIKERHGRPEDGIGHTLVKLARRLDGC